MKFPIKTTVAVVLVGAASAGFYALRAHGRSQPNYRLAEVTQGKIVSVVNATGTIQPVQSVSVGSFVSGPIKRLYVDFNSEVDKNDLLAEIDPRIYEAAVDRDVAFLDIKKAEVDRMKALLQQAKNEEERIEATRKVDRSFVSDSERDKVVYSRKSLDAELLVAEASVKQAEANLKNSMANLAYTEIRSPVKGKVIHRKINQGQTLAAQFQTPELFIVAPDMKTRMHIIAAVDEADIGLIREAERRKLGVNFTVDSCPGDLFPGRIVQIRLNSTTTQNVVTYPVVVEAPNEHLKLLPDMTANLSFEVDEIEQTLRIPNAALRYYPQREHVRPEDRMLLDGAQPDANDDNDNAAARRSAADKAEARRNRNRRHVWVTDGEHLRAVPVVTGLTDNRWTQLVSGDLSPGQKLVTGIKTSE